MKALAEDLSVLDDHRADERVRADASASPLGEIDAAGDPSVIGGRQIGHRRAG